MDFVRPVQAVVPGSRGRVLAVLAESTGDVNLRTLARLAGVSIAQVPRIMPELVQLGLVARRDVPPAAQFRLVPEHLATRAILQLARARDTTLRRMGELAASMPIPPLSIVVFGSLARGTAGTDSDIDVVVVRPDDTSEDDEAWRAGADGWRRDVEALTGNRVDMVEVSVTEARARLRAGSGMWRAVRREGIRTHGLPVTALMETADA